jgi:hypothetical protein
MNRLLAVLGAVLLAAPVGAQEEPMSSDFYPLRKGTTWTYKATGNLTLVAQVTAHEKVGKEACAKIETKVNGETVNTEYIAVRENGLFRVKVGDKEYNPPLCFLKLPPKKDDKWEVKSTSGSETLSGTFETTEKKIDFKDTKEINAFEVKSKDMTVNGQKISLSYLFAEKIGIVKQTVNLAGAEVTLDLTDFKDPQQ